MMDSIDIVGGGTEESDVGDNNDFEQEAHNGTSKGIVTIHESAEQESDIGEEKATIYDVGGFVKYTYEEVGNASGDEEENVRQREAGFSSGLIPAEWEKSILKGSTFKTWKEYNEAMEEYEARSGYKFSRIKKRTNIARAVCRGWDKQNPDSCKVELSARCLKKTGLITISKVYLIHTCNQAIHKFRSGANKTAWVARTVLNHVRVNLNTPVKNVVETMRISHGTLTQPWTAQRARVACREKIAGGSKGTLEKTAGFSKETFEKIPAYVDTIRDADPNGHAVYEIGEDSHFARLFIATASSMHAANSCRMLVRLDGTQTGGKFPMTLLLSTCFDGENLIDILAWGLVSHENDENWTWYMEQLRTSFPVLQKSGVVFVSTPDKGLNVHVERMFPNCFHGHCVQHMQINISKNMDMACSKYFKQIAEAKTKEEFEKLLSDFKPATEKQGKFVDYVQKVLPKSYARHVFPARRYGHNTSNVVEILNQLIQPCRSMPALLLSDYLWCYVMENHHERAKHAKQLPETQFALTKYANNMLNGLFRESQGVEEKSSSDIQSLMVDNKGSWVLNIEERYCECLDWQEMDFPCVHAVRWLANHDKDSRKYVGKVWLASTQREAYSVPVPRISIDRLPKSDRPCFAPVLAPEKKDKKPRKRKPSWGEQQARNNDRLRKQNQKCGRCKMPGHNQRNCMYEPPQEAAGPAAQPQLAGAIISHNVDIAQSSHQTMMVGDTTAPQGSTADEDWSYLQARSTV